MSNPYTNADSVRAPASYSELVTEVTELLRAQPGSLSPESNLFDSGLDSIRLMLLIERYRACGIDVSFVELAENPTLTELARLVGVPGAPIRSPGEGSP